MRADRLLSILLLLQVHRRVTARQLAKRLEVSERTILRDMDALSGSGVPVVAERGAGGGWSLLDDYQTKLTGLSGAEIQSLFLARPPRLMADLGLKQEAEAAMIKLQASLPASSRLQADLARQWILIDTRGWRDPGESIPSLPILLDALWRGRQVRFLYRKVLCEASERFGHPLGLVAKGSVWYLVANVEGETRTYRVSRISQAVILDEASLRPAKFDLEGYWERSAAEFRENLPRYYATFWQARRSCGACAIAAGGWSRKRPRAIGCACGSVSTRKKRRCSSRFRSAAISRRSNRRSFVRKSLRAHTRSQPGIGRANSRCPIPF
jgi:predicted DNA-binding transcriptional regulator YafY